MHRSGVPKELSWIFQIHCELSIGFLARRRACPSGVPPPSYRNSMGPWRTSRRVGSNLQADSSNFGIRHLDRSPEESWQTGPEKHRRLAGYLRKYQGVPGGILVFKKNRQASHNELMKVARKFGLPAVGNVAGTIVHFLKSKSRVGLLPMVPPRR